MLAKTAACLILLITALAGNTQQLNTDSLLVELGKSKKDTGKVILYRMLAGIFRLRDPQQGISYGKAGIELGKKLNFDKGVAGCYLNVSASYSSLGIFDTGLNYIDTAIYYARKVGDANRLALVYLNRADFFMQLQNFTQSLKDCDTSLQYAEKVNSDDRRARVYQTIGSVYFYQDLYPQSEEYFNKANNLYRKLNNLQMSAIVLNNLALVHKNTGDYQKAAGNLLTAVEIADSLKDHSNLSLYHGSLSDVYLNLNSLKKAEEHGNLSMGYAQQVGNERQIANAWLYLGNAYLKQQRHGEATNALMNAYRMFRQQSDLDKINTSAGMLAEAYSATGEHAKAYEYLTISKSANDTLVKQRYDDDIAAMQTRFRVDEKDKEIELLDKTQQLQQHKLKQSRFLLFTSIAIAALALAGLFLLISRNRLRSRMKELQLRNQIASDLHDEVGSSLSSIHMLSEMASSQEMMGPSQRDILGKVSSFTKETMEKMGDIVWMIKPSSDLSIGLKDRMQRFLYDVCNSKNIFATLDVSTLEKLNLNMEQRKGIYLIFKEAVNNAAKYSNARNIFITTSLSGGHIIFEIKDDGKGFDLASVNKGNGLDNIMSRAKELGGHAEIHSENGKGTRIKLRLPL